MENGPKEPHEGGEREQKNIAELQKAIGPTRGQKLKQAHRSRSEKSVNRKNFQDWAWCRGS